MTGVDFAAFKEQQYDILAAELRKHLDMKKKSMDTGKRDYGGRIEMKVELENVKPHGDRKNEALRSSQKSWGILP